MAKVLIVSGASAYADQWHDFAQTSGRLADIIAASGHSVSISEEVESALADLRGVDLAVVNIGCPRPERPAEALVPVSVGLTAHLTRGGGLSWRPRQLDLPHIHAVLAGHTRRPLGPRDLDASAPRRRPRTPDPRRPPDPDRHDRFRRSQRAVKAT